MRTLDEFEQCAKVSIKRVCVKISMLIAMSIINMLKSLSLCLANADSLKENLTLEWWGLRWGEKNLDIIIFLSKSRHNNEWVSEWKNVLFNGCRFVR
jgi:hypothetical protein